MTLIDRVRRYWGYSLLEKLESMSELYWLWKTQCLYKRFFGGIGSGSKLISPMRLKRVEHMFIGPNVTINKYAFLLTASLPNGGRPKLVIGDGCVIGHMNHITAVDEVIIGRRVLTADRVHISDNSHEFQNVNVPVVDQPIVTRGRVSIGEGTWIGENASILSCHIGKQCVIGSNAVVLTNIPDYCVAAGVPARVIRKWNPATGEWMRPEAG